MKFYNKINNIINMGNIKTLFTLSFIFFVTLIHISAQDLSLYQKYQFVVGGDTLPYRILLPENFDPTLSYPLVLFLHGSGESGNDNEKQLKNGASLFLKDTNRKKYPAIVVFPQNPNHSYWSNVQMVVNEKQRENFYFQNGGEPSTSMKLLMALTNNLFEQYNIKKDQVYVMGLSMGGMGTFELVSRMPGTFAAAIPICGGANPLITENLKNTSWWVFHGAKDDIVPSHFSETMVFTMKQRRIDVNFTLYQDANHNSWDAAFKEPYLLSWLFSKTKKTK